MAHEIDENLVAEFWKMDEEAKVQVKSVTSSEPEEQNIVSEEE